VNERLVLDIGNSAVTLARFRDGVPVAVASVVHAGVAEDRFGSEFATAIAGIDDEVPAGVAHVNAAVKDRVVRLLAPRRVFVAPGDFTPNVVNACEHPETVGLDRLFNAAALDRSGRFVVVDAGTAITVDLVEHGVFRGGAIAPGIRLCYGALHRHTGQLPLVEPAPGELTALGRHTRAALRAGVELGLAGLVDRLVADLIATLDPPREDVRVVVTGGDAALLAARVRAATRHDRELMLRGIASALDVALERG
jgi:type III pantothenate kinase